ncbi:MAG: hypothetical protein EBS68_16650 [Rhodobacteraceae bacterium]|nr:hypothetical protein [Paracoccaceae bacterium]
MAATAVKTHQAVWAEAKAAGDQAVAALLETQWYKESEWGGACGFAWVEIQPATSTFVKYLKSAGIGRKGYPKGWAIWAHPAVPPKKAQDVGLKEAWARAVAAKLREHGIEAYAASRLD